MYSDEVQICTAKNPMPSDADVEYWKHPDAVEVGTAPEPKLGPMGQIVVYRCPNCGHEHEVQVP